MLTFVALLLIGRNLGLFYFLGKNPKIGQKYFASPKVFVHNFFS